MITSSRSFIAALLVASLGLTGCNLHFDLDSVAAPVQANTDQLDTDVTDVEDTDTDASDAGDTDTPDVDDTDTHDSGDADDPDADADDAGDVDEPDTDPIEPPSCAEIGLLSCGERCVDTNVDPDHCGTCNNACDITEACVASECQPVACPGDVPPLTGDCDPVNQTGCAGSNACELRFVPPPTLEFRPSCQAIENLGDGQLGDSCEPGTGTDCGPGLHCHSFDPPDPRLAVCVKMCELATGAGCAEDEFCTLDDPDADYNGVGFCTKTCDLLATGACPAGQACAPNKDFPDLSCQPSARCLQNGGFSQKAEFSPCSVNNLHTNGCPADLRCMRNANDNQRCLKPCDTFADCDGRACEPAPAPFAHLRFCQAS
ncbi:hypothetical protein [Lujinxingia vulgaris]|uniref:hypothetical protein n=1 Tax=Lujinxingia vulgaris TaxID=2600176 RepID=UPI001E4DCA5D|nr:hypothetical protein [Lujinxingia vulgaris]